MKLAALFALLSGFLCNSMFGEAASASPKVVIAHGALNARIASFWVAQEQNLFAKYGSDSTLVLVRQIPVLIGGLTSGDIDIAVTGGGALMGTAVGGLDVKMVAVLNARVGYDLVTTPSIKSPKDLRSKRFSIQTFDNGL